MLTTHAAEPEEVTKQVIVIVGSFPPPVHGRAAVNAAVRDVLRHLGTEIEMIEIGGRSLERAVSKRLRRLPRVLNGLARMATNRRCAGGALYTSVSGGWGQVYEAAFVLLARLHRMRVFLHHHTFAHIDAPSSVARFLVWVAGPEAVHIGLSEGMASRLRSIYRIERVETISNAAFLTSLLTTGTRHRRSLATLGFLSNIALEKGIFEFLDLMVAVGERGLPLHAKLAGPFQDRRTEEQVRVRLRAAANVEYVGPKYGPEKDDFFSEIDALVFPTQYSNEAEPLTLHEAMCRGIPVIAYGRGCIPEIVGPDCGKVIAPTEPFVNQALEQIQLWMSNSVEFARASLGAMEKFTETFTQSQQCWETLLAELMGARAKQSVRKDEQEKSVSEI